MRFIYGVACAVICAFFPHINGQDYGYSRGPSHAGKKPNDRNVVATGAVAGVVGCFVGYLWSSRSIRKKAEQDFLKMTSVQDAQYLKKELQWQQEYLKLYELFSDLEKELVERDYEEFKAPDVNNDERITRDEFNDYVRKYLASFPELSRQDFPSFDEFDFEPDGSISFSEWQRFLAKQKLIDAEKAKHKDDKGITNLLDTNNRRQQVLGY